MTGLALVLIGGLASDASATRSACRKGSTIAKTERARVFRIGDTVLGCLYSTRRPVELAVVYRNEGSDYGQLDRVRIAGRFVAFGQSQAGRQEQVYSVEVVDLRSGKGAYYPTGELPDQVAQSCNSSGHQCAGVGPTTDLELRNTGAVAWIANNVYARFGLYPENVRREVHRAQAGTDVLLDAGPDIDPRSLKRRGRTISWMNAGQTRSASLR